MKVELGCQGELSPAAWYVIQTKPKKEGNVFAMLRRASFEVFLPQIKGVSAFKPLFPSYLFIHANLKNLQIHRLVYFTRGVQRILGDIEGPQSVTDDVINTVKSVTKNGSIVERDLLFQEGDEVTVKKGFLKDLRGIVEKRLADDLRIQILYKWLNMTVHAVVKYSEVDAA